MNPGVRPDLSEADLVSATLSNFDLVRVNLPKANLHGASLSRASLSSSNLSGANLHGASLSRASLSSSNLRGANLRGANLYAANLQGADLQGADLRAANLHVADLQGANLQGANLYAADLREANLQGANLQGADLRGTNLREANLHGTNLRESSLSAVDLREANLSGFDLSRANLCEASLVRGQVLGTNFEKAVLTGACLEDWNTNSATNFEGAICDYVYLKENQRERRPREGSFKPGEFAALFQQAVDTVDLIFKDGIDWQAFFQSFQDLRSQYADQELSIQGIEKKRGGAFVVRLEVAEYADKKAIESNAKQLYESQLKTLEAQYEQQLCLQGAHLEDIQSILKDEREERTRLSKVVEKLADGQRAPKYDLSNAQFAGGFAETVAGDQIGGTINNAAAETPSLAEAAAEIQNLLKQLEVSNSAATEAEQTAYLSAMIPPTRRERFIGALRAASGAAIEEVPYGLVLKALVEGWQKPNG